MKSAPREVESKGETEREPKLKKINQGSKEDSHGIKV